MSAIVEPGLRARKQCSLRYAGLRNIPTRELRLVISGAYRVLREGQSINYIQLVVPRPFQYALDIRLMTAEKGLPSHLIFETQYPTGRRKKLRPKEARCEYLFLCDERIPMLRRVLFSLDFAVLFPKSLTERLFVDRWFGPAGEF